MFDLPNAKRVRRTEINPRSPSTEPSDPDPDLEARFHDQLSNLYRTETEAELSTVEPHADDAVIPINNAPDASDDAYEFRLFSAPSAKPSAPHPPPNLPQRIILRSPTPPTSDPGFLTPRRPSQYYFTGRPPPPKLAQYRLAAITGEEILAGLNIPWRGSELPWRVTILTSPPQRKPSEATPPADTVAGKRKKSGKKRRIAMRKRVVARLAQESAKRQSRVEKEAAAREKRTRRNREKKVKRKGKEKAKKAEAIVEDD